MMISQDQSEMISRELENTRAELSRTQKLLKMMVSKKIQHDEESSQMQFAAVELEGLHTVINLIIESQERGLQILSKIWRKHPSILSKREQSSPAISQMTNSAQDSVTCLFLSQNGDDKVNENRAVTQSNALKMLNPDAIPVEKDQFASSGDLAFGRKDAAARFDSLISCMKELESDLQVLRTHIESRDATWSAKDSSVVCTLEEHNLQEMQASWNKHQRELLLRIEALEAGIFTVGTTCCSELQQIQSLVQDVMNLGHRSGSGESTQRTILEDEKKALHKSLSEMVPVEFLEFANEQLRQRDEDIHHLHSLLRARHAEVDLHTPSEDVACICDELTKKDLIGDALIRAKEKFYCDGTRKHVAMGIDIPLSNSGTGDDSRKDDIHWLERIMSSTVPKSLFEVTKEELDGKTMDNCMLRQCLQEMVRKEEATRHQIQSLHARVELLEHCLHALSQDSENFPKPSYLRDEHFMNRCPSLCLCDHHCCSEFNLFPITCGRFCAEKQDNVDWAEENRKLEKGDCVWILAAPENRFSRVDLNLVREMLHNASLNSYCDLVDRREIALCLENDFALWERVRNMTPKEWTILIRCHEKERNLEIDHLKICLERMVSIEELNALRDEKRVAMEQVERLQNLLEAANQDTEKISSMQIEMEGFRSRVVRMQKVIDASISRFEYDAILSENQTLKMENDWLHSLLRERLSAAKLETAHLKPDDTFFGQNPISLLAQETESTRMSQDHVTIIARTHRDGSSGPVAVFKGTRGCLENFNL